MKKVVLSMMTALLVMFIVGCSQQDEESSESAEGAEEKPTITLGVTPWTSTVPPTEIAQILLEDMGYTVEQTQADAGSTYIGLSRGDVDVFMDGWFPVHDVYIEKYSDTIEETAVSYEDADSGLVVPSYMEDVNSIEDLKGMEADMNNELYGIEEGASVTQNIDKLIEDYELDMKQVNSSEGGMIAQAMRKMESEDPVVFYGWRPHTMFNKLDIKMLEDPQGIFESATVQVITNKELQEKAPDAYEFLSNWSIPLDDVEEMILKIEEEEIPAKEVAQEWIDNNQDKVDKMLGE
ncbi:glycine betaine/proline transport system substrate-binding protein [Gracilibacillus orientalis]|uniref:Glycine betaine/proline transport system substrate-binding protein n=1 Tax=Gracilibacillus orientalis TaxID=334253 RepID=A0A1I4IYK7_9BACI|nr:glycine betaine ABC transporter substrate-binding protein [Gracilibacillus orientalis]SFL59415.1 glycine betaine/proline transport system substrate-binding protein [Gracilibacillus orientalis]